MALLDLKIVVESLASLLFARYSRLRRIGTAIVHFQQDLVLDLRLLTVGLQRRAHRFQ